MTMKKPGYEFALRAPTAILALTALVSACSPVTPSLDKYSSLARPGPATVAGPSLRVITVSQLDDNPTSEDDLPGDQKLTLSEDELGAQFEEFKATGKTRLEFEGEPESNTIIGFRYPFAHTTNKKDLQDQNQFRLRITPAAGTDNKSWSVTIEDKSPDADAGRRARQHLLRISSFITGGKVKLLTSTPEPAVSAEPSAEPSADPLTEPSGDPTSMPSLSPSSQPSTAPSGGPMPALSPSPTPGHHPTH